MAFPTTTVLDTFDRADENPLASANWTNKTRSNNQNAPRIVSNQLGNVDATFAASAWWNLEQFAAPLEAFVTIANISSDVGVDYMITSPGGTTPDFYRFQTAVATPGFQLFRVDNGTFTAIGNGGAGWSATIGVGDTFGVHLESTTLHTFYHRPSGGSWTVIGTSVDTTYTSGTGFIGVGMGANASVRANDFGGGATILTEFTAGGQRRSGLAAVS